MNRRFRGRSEQWAFPVLFCILLLSGITGCATSDEVGRMTWELNTLKSEVQGIKKKSKSIETQLPGQTREFDQMLRELEEKQNATSKTVSDLLIEVQDLTGEVQKLTGQFEESRYFSEKSSAELHENKEALIARLSALESEVSELKTKSTAPVNVQHPVNNKGEKANEVYRSDQGIRTDEQARKSKVKDVYMAAYQDFRSGKTAQAREQFISLLEKYPENEYSDNSRFWVAESYYIDGSYEDAILAYEELFKKNPKSDKIPGAMLKQGLAFYALKDKKTGTIVLEKLVEKYPNSEPARLALKKMNKTVPLKKTN